MFKVLERVNSRYETEEVQRGKVYKWKPESLLVECECGETTTLTASDTTCEECGRDHGGLSLEKTLAEQRRISRHQLGEEDLHPWRHDEDSEEEDEDPILWA